MRAECSAGVNLQPLTCALWGMKRRELQVKTYCCVHLSRHLCNLQCVFLNEYLYSSFATLLEFLNLLKSNQRENG